MTSKKKPAPRQLPKKPKVLERAQALKEMGVEFLRFTYQVDFLVTKNGKPQKVMTSEPIVVMAADFEEHVLNIPEMKRMVESQLSSDPDA